MFLRVLPLISLFALTAAPAIAASQMMEEPVRSISVNAEGKMEAVPDRAILPLEINTQHKKLDEAKDENDKLTSKLLAITKKYKIQKEKVKTSGVRINPQYRWDKGKSYFQHYEVSRTMQITIDELENTEHLISEFTTAGIDRIQGVQFTLSNPNRLESEARISAMKQARAKAQELAAAAGAKLGKVLTISLSGNYHQPQPMMMKRMSMAADVAESAGFSPPTTPGLITIEQNVSASFELE